MPEPPRLPRLLPEGLQGAPGRRRAVLLARNALRVRNIRLTGVPVADRAAALNAQLQAWEPWPEAVYLVAWQRPDDALAFAADGAWLSAQLAPDAVPGTAAAELPTLWPEPLLREPCAEGVRLLHTIDGFEGQLWQAGLLRASRWWRAAPNANEWALFLRSLGVDAAPDDGQTPVPQSAAWLARPYLEVKTGATDAAAALGTERWWVATAVGTLLFFSGALAHQALRLNEAKVALEAERVRLTQAGQPVLVARDRALASSSSTNALAQSLTAPLPLDVLDHLSSVLPAKGVVLREFDLAGSTLRLALETVPEVSRSELITRLQSGGWLTQVAETRETQRANGITLEMQLAGASPPLRMSADAGLKRASNELPAAPPTLPQPVPARP